MSIKNRELLLFGEESERLQFRKLETSDFDNWLEFCLDPESLKFIWLTDSESPKDRCEAWFFRVMNRYATGKGGMNVLIEKGTNDFVGQCGLLIHFIDGKEELEIGYSLMPNKRGVGYAIEAAKKCRDYAFENELAESLISIIDKDNVSSATVALKNGMQAEKEVFYNKSQVVIYRIKREDWLNLNEFESN